LGTRRRNSGAGEKAFNQAGLNFSGSIKTRRQLKGGGSNTSGFNNGGISIGTRAPGIGGNMGNYSGRIKGGGKVFSQTGLSFGGSIKTRRPLKGGGSNTSGFNNGGVSIGTKTPGMGANMGNYSGYIKGRQKSFNQVGLNFSGGIKTKRALKGGGSNSGFWNNGGSAINVRAPGMGANMGNYSGYIKGRQKSFNQVGLDFSGSIKTKRALKGGGSNSGFWNNGGSAINVRAPGIGASMGNYRGNIKGGVKTFGEQGVNFSGSIKARRPLKGGGSNSGFWNNGGRPINVRGIAPGAGRVGSFSGAYKMYQLTPGFGYQGETYKGSMRSKRPLKGGGSISGFWNNGGEPVAKRTYSPASLKIGIFSGNLKAKRLEKGGGSNSGFWNNNGDPIAKKMYSPAALKLGVYAGRTKAKRPEKGGGSISGKLWNNGESPILVKAPLSADAREAGYSGKIRLPFFRKQYVHNPNSVKKALKTDRPDKTVYDVAGLQIKVRQKEAGHNKVSAKGAINGERPGKNSAKAAEYEGRMKMLWAYKHNPSSNKKALATIKPTDYFMKGNDFSGRARMQHYVHNPKSNKHALKVLAPARAVARVRDYQGNTRMSKPSGKNLLPDAQFAHGFRDNVKRERTFLINVKLMWTKLFKKNGTQPDAVKDKVRRPRYDKKEKELWKDLYD
jgi:hypothetical protein